MQNRDLFSFNIERNIRLKLIQAHYCTVGDLENKSNEVICSETLLTKEECEQVLNLIKGNHDFSPVLSADQLQIELQVQPISTGSTLLDQILGGGIHKRRITELCGQPGAGKTQFCLQLSINCQLLTETKNNIPLVVYVDTESGFTLERLYDLAKSKYNNEILGITIESLMSNINHIRCTSFESIIEKINELPNFINENNKVQLVIIDNIANPVRLKFGSNYAKRNAALQMLVLNLLKLANQHNFAIIFTNQMTTKFSADNESCLVSALGSRWSHCIGTRILLQYENDLKWSANVIKSFYMTNESCFFTIKDSGICDIESH